MFLNGPAHFKQVGSMLSAGPDPFPVTHWLQNLMLWTSKTVDSPIASPVRISQLFFFLSHHFPLSGKSRRGWGKDGFPLATTAIMAGFSRRHLAVFYVGGVNGSGQDNQHPPPPSTPCPRRPLVAAAEQVRRSPFASAGPSSQRRSWGAPRLHLLIDLIELPKWRTSGILRASALIFSIRVYGPLLNNQSIVDTPFPINSAFLILELHAFFYHTKN